MIAWIRQLAGRVRCKLGRHAWERVTVESAGTLVVIPKCRCCPRVDVDGIAITAWNRAERRRWKRALPRRLRGARR